MEPANVKFLIFPEQEHVYGVIGTEVCRFASWSCQTKEYKICICCFSAKHTA